MSKNNNSKDVCCNKDRVKSNLPVENQKNAAWAEIDKQEFDGKVPVPSLENVIEAKEWVEENKK